MSGTGQVRVKFTSLPDAPMIEMASVCGRLPRRATSDACASRVANAVMKAVSVVIPSSAIVSRRSCSTRSTACTDREVCSAMAMPSRVVSCLALFSTTRRMSPVVRATATAMTRISPPPSRTRLFPLAESLRQNRRRGMLNRIADAITRAIL